MIIITTLSSCINMAYNARYMAICMLIDVMGPVCGSSPDAARRQAHGKLGLCSARRTQAPAVTLNSNNGIMSENDNKCNYISTAG